MLARVGKSLILVTVILTIAVVAVPARMLTLDEGGLLRALIGGDQGIVASLFFLAFIVILTIILLTYFSERRRSTSRGSGQEDRRPKIPAFDGTTHNIEGGRSVSRSGVINSLRTTTATGVHPGRLGDLSEPSSLFGSTLRTYCSLLSKRPNSVGLREMQRELGFSSPSSAIYQLEKLMRLGLVEKDAMGDYTVRKVIKVGILKDFFLIGGYAVPKNAIYGALTILINTVCFVLLLNMQAGALVYFALLPGLFSSAIFWYEALNSLSAKRSLARQNNSSRPEDHWKGLRNNE